MNETDCQATNGTCIYGCAQNFTGDTCQGNALSSLAGGGIFVSVSVIVDKKH